MQSIDFTRIDKDGTEYIFLTKDFEPSTEDEAEIIKIKRPDGSVEFGFVKERE